MWLTLTAYIAEYNNDTNKTTIIDSDYSNVLEDVQVPEAVKTVSANYEDGGVVITWAGMDATDVGMLCSICFASALIFAH